MVQRESDLKDTEYVFVNGKRVVATILEFDIEAGWVKVLLPKPLPVQEADVSQDVALASNDGFAPVTAFMELEQKILNGKVEIHDFASPSYN